MRNVRTQYPKSLRYEIVRVYLTGNNSYEELANIYKVPITNIRTWVMRYRYSKNVVSLQAESQPVEDMARKKKDAEKSVYHGDSPPVSTNSPPLFYPSSPYTGG